MFDACPDGKKGFTPMDVIPIISKSFPDSYGNMQFVRKAGFQQLLLFWRTLQ
jgi:hypothetical protein